MEKLVAVCNLSYQNILKDISFNIEEGSFIAISGTNKCGKTTLIKLLSGLLEQKENITFEKCSLDSMPKTEIYKKIGYVIPGVEMPFRFSSVEQELWFALESGDLDQEKKEKYYKKVISLLKLKNDQQLDPNCLSQFLKVKLLLARTILASPKILYLDNICSSLTKEEREEIRNILKKLNKEEHITIVMTTNHLEEVIDLDKLYVLDNGEIVLSGKPLEVLKEDSMLAKMGLSLPFMVDLSLKLKYYDLLEEIELDMDRLVNTLWK